jgi:hypothetical protein
MLGEISFTSSCPQTINGAMILARSGICRGVFLRLSSCFIFAGSTSFQCN